MPIWKFTSQRDLSLLSVRLSWCGVSNIGGYGMAYGGTEFGYGGGLLYGIVKYLVEVYRISDNVLIRSEELEISDLENPDATYTYTPAMNLSDNGYYENGLIFKVFQIGSGFSNELGSDIRSVERMRATN